MTKSSLCIIVVAPTQYDILPQRINDGRQLKFVICKFCDLNARLYVTTSLICFPVDDDDSHNVNVIYNSHVIIVLLMQRWGKTIIRQIADLQNRVIIHDKDVSSTVYTNIAWQSKKKI